MKTYDQILKEKIAYYSNTEAAREFAAREYYDGWIPVDKELPKQRDREAVSNMVLVQVKNESFPYMAFYNFDWKSFIVHPSYPGIPNTINNVISWRPIYHN